MPDDMPDQMCLDDQEPMDTVEDPYVVAFDWVSGFTGVGDDAVRATLPIGYLDDPFVLGFVHSSCLTYIRNWSETHEHNEKFVAEVFSVLFADDAPARHARALKLRQEADPAFIQGSDNADLFLHAYNHAEEFADDLHVGIALKRAKDHVARRTQAKPGSEEYAIWITDAQNHALHDVLFVNVVSERFPEKTGWRKGTLEQMAAPDLSDLDDDLERQADN
jgi:hypothetical protein